MKNLKYFPFERNRYFYGKLLTVDDFQAEQKYMNDKRRLINRFLHGSGVVCGLNVVRVDDYSISLESGVALDFSGREIVVDMPVLKRLSLIEGFDSYTAEDEDSNYLYLCIEYTEQDKNPVFNVAGSAADTEYSKVGEGYRLYLTDREPESNNAGFCYEEQKTVYWGNGIRISHILPKYVRSGQDFPFRVIVENMGQMMPVKFSYDLELNKLSSGIDDRITISFDEEQLEKARRYELTLFLHAAEIKNRQGQMKLIPGSFQLSEGGYQRNYEEPQYTGTVSIVEEELEQVIKDQFQRESLEEIMKDIYHQSIYLAKINIIRATSTYVIDSIEQMPFQQYVYNGMMSAAMDRVVEERLSRIERLLQQKDVKVKDETPCTEQESEEEYMPFVATGSVTLNLKLGGAARQTFFSDEIVHGLGPGNVRIVLGEEYGSADGSHILYGAGNIFDDPSNPTRIEMAARADVAKGTFVIGMKLLENTVAREVRIHWMAIMDEKEAYQGEEEQSLFIKPDTIYLKLRENCNFETEFIGASDCRVRWKIRETGGGTIDENGRYVAPNVPGIYEVIAESVENSELTASAFVIVRESYT